MRKKSELIFNLLLIPVDFVAIITAFVLAYTIRVKLYEKPVAEPLPALLFLKITLLIVPVWLLIFSLLGLYGMSSQRKRLEEIGKVFVAVSGGTMFMILVDFIFRQPIFPSKAVPIYGYGFSFFLVTFGRQVMRKAQRYLLSYKIGIRRVMLIGSGPLAMRIYRDLKDPGSGYEVVAVLDKDKPSSSAFEAAKTYRDFYQALKGNKPIEEIIQADSAFEAEEVLEMVNHSTNHHIGYRFVPNQFGVFAINATVSTLAGMPVMEIRHTPLDGWGRILKRLFDLAGSAGGLIILSPLLALITVIIKLSDPGPAIFAHRRLSRVGKPVWIYKFRTMYTKYSGKNPAAVFRAMGRPELIKEFKRNHKLKNDPRVTAVGGFLRRTSLDELPQLFNVFKGELSLVGPRPILKEELERYGGQQAAFLALKPGMTGLWQISGRSDIGYEERVKLDIYYLENWSLWLDIKILLKTFLALIKNRGAY